MPSIEKSQNPRLNELRPISRQSTVSMNQQQRNNFGEGESHNQFQYNQSSHASLNQWRGNPGAGTGYHQSNSGNKTRPHHVRYFHQSQQKIQPSLINLDRMDLSIPLFQYPLLSGVTMLGTGKGTVKPPDIVLHGSQVAPQHAFIERLGDDVTLHPICEITSVDGRPINVPTPLQPGNLISIGESYFFRYDGPPPSYSPTNQNPNDRIYFDESPYAVINPRSSNPSRLMADVNKNSFLTMGDSVESSSTSSMTLESQVCQTDQSFQSPRSSSASTSTSDPDHTTSSICTEDSGSHRYRDGLESEHFVNKVARFEFLSHTLPPPPFGGVNNNNICYESNGTSAINKGIGIGGGGGNDLQMQTVECSNNGSRHYYQSGNHNGYSSNNSNNSPAERSNNGYEEQTQRTFNNNKPGGFLSRPNVNFNRSDQGFGNMFSSYSSSSNSTNNNNHLDDSSFSSSSVSPPDRIPSSKSTTSSYHRGRTGGVTFYDDNVTTTTPSPASFGFLTDFEHDEETSSFVNHSSSSVPSPDSLSSISNHHAPKSQNTNHYHHNGERVPSRSSTSSTSSIIPHHYHHNNNSQFNDQNQASIACDTLLQIKRKQSEEARVAEGTQNEDKLKLDEILAMCEEYEEQIAQEILEKRTNSLTKLPNSVTPYSSMASLRISNTNGSGASNQNQNGQVQSNRGQIEKLNSNEGNLIQNPKSPTTPTGVYNYNRIKTNGSLPRDASKNHHKSPSPLSVNNNAQSNTNTNTKASFMDEEIASIFTFSVADGKTSSASNSSCNNGSNNYSFSGMQDEVFSPKSPAVVNGANKQVPNGSSQSDFILGFRNTTSPYENVMVNDSSSINSNKKSYTLEHSSIQYAQIQVQSPPRLGIRATTSNSNGRNPSELNGYSRRPILANSMEQKFNSESTTFPVTNTNTLPPLSSESSVIVTTGDNQKPTTHSNHNEYSTIVAFKTSTSSINNRNGYNSNCLLDNKNERSDTPSKSKLSVSFANSVKEFGQDDDSNDEEKIKPISSTKNSESPQVNGGSKEPSRSIFKTIATEVQVHVEQDSNTTTAGINRTSNVNNECSTSSKPNDIDSSTSSQPIQSPPSICISNCRDDDKSTDDDGSTRNQCSPSSLSSFSTNASQNLSQNETTSSESTSLHKKSESVQNNPETINQQRENPYQNQISFSENRIVMLKKEIRDIEEQEMEAIREVDIEKALLVGEEKSLENQLALENEELAELKDRLAQIDESNRRWKVDGLERISELKTKLMSSEKELQRLERMHEEFCGSTDEETVLLERLKFQHEQHESDRKAFEDSEFYHIEEEINKETHRDELSRLVTDKGRRLLSRQLQLEKVQNQNRISFESSTKEIQNLENRRQDFIKELRKIRNSSKQAGERLCIPEVDGTETFSDCEDTMNSDLEEKLKSLSILSSSPVMDDAMHIERIKSRSPIDPHMGGPKTCKTLREIEKNREFLLNEQGAQMLEEERARVKALQKRVQESVVSEWESRKSRNNQCQSLNSVGSEDSGHTASDTPTDSGSGDDTTDKSAAPSIPSTTDGSSGNGLSNGQNSFELCQQMRQKQREMSQNYDETRPLSDGSAYDENDSSIVTRRDKQRVQNRPLTRYLPVRGDEDEFDLRHHIESSGHQLELLCPHITVTRTAARGFLSKLGSRFHNWNKRWFVFDRETRTLSYYTDKNEKKSKRRGGVHFEAIEDIYVDHLQSVQSAKSPVPKLTFCVKTYNRVFYLLAPSPEAMRVWVDIIFTGAEGYKEFKCGS